MKIMLWATLLVCTLYSARCQQVDANPQGGDGATEGDSNANTLDKNQAVINELGVFFNKLNNDLLYLRDFVMNNVGKVGFLLLSQQSAL